MLEVEAENVEVERLMLIDKVNRFTTFMFPAAPIQRYVNTKQPTFVTAIRIKSQSRT